MQKIKILLTDDYALIRSGLRLLIDSYSDFEVIGELDNGNDVLGGVIKMKPDILILDLSMPGADIINVIKNLRNNNISVKILVLTNNDDEQCLKESIQAGANGYLLKRTTESELITALKMIFVGVLFIDPTMAGNLATKVWSERDGKESNESNLSTREVEVLRLIALGYTNREIAKELLVSIKTIESHKANIKFKLNKNHRSELVKFAIERKVI